MWNAGTLEAEMRWCLYVIVPLLLWDQLKYNYLSPTKVMFSPLSVYPLDHSKSYELIVMQFFGWGVAEGTVRFWWQSGSQSGSRSF